MQTWIHRSGVAVVSGIAVASALSMGCSSSSSPPAAPGDSGSTTLYERLGGSSGIEAAVVAIVKAELQDPSISTYFVNQTTSPVPAGHPSADQLEACFTDLIGSLTGGPQVYPTTVTTDAGSFTCRSMAVIHQPFMISGGTFDQFVMIAGSTLTGLGVATADVATLAGALEATRSEIVDAPLNDAGLQPLPGSNDGGSEQ
jgi:hypothetical protein